MAPRKVDWYQILEEELVMIDPDFLRREQVMLTGTPVCLGNTNHVVEAGAASRSQTCEETPKESLAA